MLIHQPDEAEALLGVVRVKLNLGAFEVARNLFFFGRNFSLQHSRLARADKNSLGDTKLVLYGERPKALDTRN